MPSNREVLRVHGMLAVLAGLLLAACSSSNAANAESQGAGGASIGVAAGGREVGAGGQGQVQGTSIGAAGSGGQAATGTAGKPDLGPGSAGTGASSSSMAGQGGPCTGASCSRAGAGGSGTSGSTMTGGDAGAGVDPAPPTPDPRYLVAATGPCPEFQDGNVMFMPDGMQRQVLLFMSDAAKDLDGPLIFSWHTTLPGPDSAPLWLGDAQIEEIKAQGGIVAAPATGYPNETRPWDSIPMGPAGKDGDQRLMDEVVACAMTKVGIDLRRIHSIGMSAGGLKTAQVSLRRSGYLASVVVYSGGLVDGDNPPDQNPDNKFAAMILYGGPSDISPVDGINYTDASQNYLDLLKSKGRFGFLCNHGGGHSVPQDSQASAWQFMQDHPYGTTPSPYSLALPNGFLRYCSL